MDVFPEPQSTPTWVFPLSLTTVKCKRYRFVILRQTYMYAYRMLCVQTVCIAVCSFGSYGARCTDRCSPHCLHNNSCNWCAVFSYERNLRSWMRGWMDRAKLYYRYFVISLSLVTKERLTCLSLVSPTQAISGTFQLHCNVPLLAWDVVTRLSSTSVVVCYL